MSTNMPVYVAVIIALALLSGCGGGGGSSAAVCTPSGNMTLYTSASMSTLLTGITVTAAQNATVPPEPVWVKYRNPPVAVVLAGYPAGGVDPLTVGIDIIQSSPSTSNPLRFDTTFNANRSKATYEAVLRFVATDLAMSQVLGCQDVPVTFVVN